MKKLLVVTMVIGSVAVAFSAQNRKSRPKLTPQQKQELIMMKLGGYISQPIKTTVVRIYNNQNIVPAEVIRKIVANMGKGPNFPAEVVTAEWSVESAKEPGVGFAIVIVNDEKSPNKVLCAPDDGWIKVNVAPFAKGAPSADVLNDRVLREVWRGFAYALGAGNTLNPMCPLKTVTTMEEFDALSAIVPCPDVLGTIQKAGEQWGINRTRVVSYRKACQEGWAPAPTNDYQKVIWEEVKAKPTNPMKIKYDPNKGE